MRAWPSGRATAIAANGTQWRDFVACISWRRRRRRNGTDGSSQGLNWRCGRFYIHASTDGHADKRKHFACTGLSVGQTMMMCMPAEHEVWFAYARQGSTSAQTPGRRNSERTLHGGVAHETSCISFVCRDASSEAVTGTGRARGISTPLAGATETGVLPPPPTAAAVSAAAAAAVPALAAAAAEPPPSILEAAAVPAAAAAACRRSAQHRDPNTIGVQLFQELRLRARRYCGSGPEIPHEVGVTRVIGRPLPRRVTPQACTREIDSVNERQHLRSRSCQH